MKTEQHELPPLPYPLSALEPFLSKESFQYHYEKHHKNYVEKTNELVKGTKYEDSTLEEIIQSASGPLLNNAAQAWNHTFFWNSMTPRKKKLDSEGFLDIFKVSFESQDAFAEEFISKGAEHFGSGWIWLSYDDHKLLLETTTNADNPMRLGRKPILVCDLWEHAYYIDYRNKKEKFLEAFMRHINWDFAVSNFESDTINWTPQRLLQIN